METIEEKIERLRKERAMKIVRSYEKKIKEIEEQIKDLESEEDHRYRQDQEQWLRLCIAKYAERVKELEEKTK